MYLMVATLIPKQKIEFLESTVISTFYTTFGAKVFVRDTPSNESIT